MKTTALIITALALTSSAAMADIGRSTASGSAQAAATGTFEVAQNRTYLDVVASLKAEGYTVSKVTKSWLGRIKIMAKSAAHLREVVVSRTTGEIMSDVIVEVYAKGLGAGSANATTTDTGISLDYDTDVDVGGSVGLGSSGSGAGVSVSGSVSIGVGN